MLTVFKRNQRLEGPEGLEGGSKERAAAYDPVIEKLQEAASKGGDQHIEFAVADLFSKLAAAMLEMDAKKLKEDARTNFATALSNLKKAGTTAEAFTPTAAHSGDDEAEADADGDEDEEEVGGPPPAPAAAAAAKKKKKKAAPKKAAAAAAAAAAAVPPAGPRTSAAPAAPAAR